MEHKCNCGHGNISSNNGFLSGLLVGVILTLLVTTKKGRELLRTILDESMDKFEDLEDLLKEQERRLEREENVTRYAEEVTVSIPKDVEQRESVDRDERVEGEHAHASVVEEPEENIKREEPIREKVEVEKPKEEKPKVMHAFEEEKPKEKKASTVRRFFRRK